MKQLDKSTLNYIVSEYLSTGQKVAAIRYVREVTGAGLAEAKDLVDKMFEEYKNRGTLSGFYSYEDNTVYGAVDVRAVEEHVLRNYSKDSLIPAIKYYREATGVGLAEAKTAVERLLRTTYPSTEASKAETKQAAKRRKFPFGGVILVLIGAAFIGLALYLFISVPKKKEANIAEIVNAITDTEKERLFSEGYTEYITDGNYLGYDFWYDTTQDNGRLFVYKSEDKEDGYLGVLYDDKPKYPGGYCDGIAIYYTGETKTDTVEIREGRNDVVYENVMIVNSDNIEVYGVPSWKPQVEIDKAKKLAMSMAIPLGLWGLGLAVIGALNIRSVRRE